MSFHSSVGFIQSNMNEWKVSAHFGFLDSLKFISEMSDLDLQILDIITSRFVPGSDAAWTRGDQADQKENSPSTWPGASKLVNLHHNKLFYGMFLFIIKYIFYFYQ